MSNKLPVKFFRTPQGAEPALEFIRACSREERAIIGEDLRVAQDRWPPGLPLSRSLAGGLHEIRITLPTRSVRLVVCIHGGTLAILHAFFKTTQQTPLRDLKIARARMKGL